MMKIDIPEYSKELVWKVPLIKNAKHPIKNYKKDLPENETRFNEEFFNKYDGNWGFYTKENQIAVMDFDCRSGKKPEVIKLLNKNHDTKIIETKNGFHIYYKINGEFPNKTLHYKNAGYSKSFKKFYNKNETKYGNKLEGIDIIAGTNVLVVGENSIINNHIYKTINNKPIKTIERESWDAILSSYLMKKPRQMREGFTRIFRGEIDPNILAQQTNKSEFVYWKFAYVEALRVCQLEPEYLLEGLEANNKGFDKKTTTAQLQSTNSPEDKDLMLDETYNEYFPKNKVKVKVIKEDKTKPYIRIAKKILNKIDLITMTDSQQILMRGSNVYRADMNGVLNTIINKEIEGYNLNYTVKTNIINYIKDKTQFGRDGFCYEPHLINFKNGYFDILENKFVNKTEKIFPFEIPHDYEDGKYDCPRYKEALNKWLTNSVFRPEDMFEVIGYCLTLDISQKKAFMFYGERDTGKTQNLSIILALMGKENYELVELQRLDKDQFGTDGLEFAMGCVDDDLPSYQLRRASKFKKMVGGLEMVPAEKKGGSKYKFRNTVKFLFNCNSIPKAPDHEDDAFFVRWLLCNFSNRFDEDSSDTIKDFAKTIISDNDEIQGIIHEAIKGLQRLLERGYFRKEVRDNTKKVWQRISNPVYRFLGDHCLKNSSYTIRTTEFRDVINAYLVEEGEEILSAPKVVSEMEKLGFRTKRTSEGRHFVGLRIKDESIEMLEVSGSDNSLNKKENISMW